MFVPRFAVSMNSAHSRKSRTVESGSFAHFVDVVIRCSERSLFKNSVNEGQRRMCVQGVR